MSVDYQAKYLKYKKKYLELKYGGKNDEENIFMLYPEDIAYKAGYTDTLLKSSRGQKELGEIIKNGVSLGGIKITCKYNKIFAEIKKSLSENIKRITSDVKKDASKLRDEAQRASDKLHFDNISDKGKEELCKNFNETQKGGNLLNLNQIIYYGKAEKDAEQQFNIDNIKKFLEEKNILTTENLNKYKWIKIKIIKGTFSDKYEYVDSDLPKVTKE